jgi:hypothetical protein
VNAHGARGTAGAVIPAGSTTERRSLGGRMRSMWRSDPHRQDDYLLVSGLFLRSLALIYLAAFASVGVQISGLAGSGGILPYAEELRFIQGTAGIERYWQYPSVFWFDASDIALQFASVVGCVLSVLLFFNRLPRLCLILLFVLYLSLFQAGSIFMNFQWDYLLLESGFLAIFLPGGSRFVVWLFRWLLFRFRFLSGAMKLVSQDPTWIGLTALNYYFETQPLPHVGAWYANQLPEWILMSGVVLVLFVELVVPFMMFLSRGPRFFAAWATILLQVLILLTSNHNFFNLLTIVLCLFLFDDRALGRVIPAPVAERLRMRPRVLSGTAARLRNALLGTLTLAIVSVSAVMMWELFTSSRIGAGISAAVDYLRPFHVVNNYHVFPTMKTDRIELIIEGSEDGKTWIPYVFRYKPGDTARRPEVVIPHQPRLDWMMWFVPMGHPMNLMWLDPFLNRLLENSPAVLGLLASNPFPDRPPRYLRLGLYRYHFTDSEGRAATGQWWTREYLWPFYPFPFRERLTSP